MYRRLLSQSILVLTVVLLTSWLQPIAHITALAQPGCNTFKETGKTACGRFLQYWQQNGGLSQQGFPISNEFKEISDLDGKTYTVQYFERAVFELHPENKPPYDVLLSQLGTFQFRTKYKGVEPGTPPPPTATIKGQVVIIPNDAGIPALRAVVTDVSETKTVPETEYEKAVNASGKFVVVLMTVTNQATESASVGSRDFRLKDGKGRLFDMADLAPHFAARDYYKRGIFYDKIQPGLSLDMVVLFDVAPDASDYVLVLNQ